MNTPLRKCVVSVVGSLAVLFLAGCGPFGTTPGNGGGPSSTERSCSSGTDCVFDGVPNRSLGGAKLRLNAQRNLIVEGMGSSGRDGVRQYGVPHDTVAMSAGMACPNFIASIQGSKMDVVMYGDVVGEVISHLIIENIDGTNIDVKADLSPLGVTLYAVQIFNGNKLVADETGLSNSIVRFPALTDYRDMLCGIHPGGQIWIQYQRTTPGIIITPEGKRVIGDVIMVMGEDQKVTPSVQTAFDNFFTNVPALEMTFQKVASTFE